MPLEAQGGSFGISHTVLVWGTKPCVNTSHTMTLEAQTGGKTSHVGNFYTVPIGACFKQGAKQRTGASQTVLWEAQTPYGLDLFLSCGLL